MKNKLNKKMLGVFKRQKHIISTLDSYGKMRYPIYENRPQMECIYFQIVKKKRGNLALFSPLVLI